jgi:hypothetical protein
MLFADRRQAAAVSYRHPGGGDDGSCGHLARARSGPEVIFFDRHRRAAAHDQELEQSDKDAGSIIHVIEFKSGPAQGKGETLRKLAEQNRGEYKYVDVSKLPAAAP